MLKYTFAALLLASSSAQAALMIPPTDDVRVVAICTDGFQWRAHIAHGNGHRGACARHHGVREWTDGTKVRAKSLNHT